MNNEKIWDDYGLSMARARIAEDIMPYVMMAAKRLNTYGDDEAILTCVCKASIFQVFHLPSCTEEYQKDHKWVEITPPTFKLGR